MISVSSAFKDLVNSDNRNYIINATITLVDEDNTVLHITNENIWDNGVSFSEGTSSTSSFDVGSTVMSELTLVLNNIYNDFSGYDFFDATVEVRIGLIVNGELEDFRKGFYTVEKPTYNGSLITLKCIDNMWKFEVPFDDIEITYPTTIGYIVGAICTHCGVLLEDANFRNKNFTIAEKPDEEMNCREVISHLAQICCCFARITNDGKLRIRWYADDYADPEDDLDGGIFDNYSPYRTGDTADGGNFTDWSSGDNYDGGTFGEWADYINIRSISSVDICTDNIIVTGVKVSYSSKATDYVLNGQEGYILKIQGNPFISSQAIATQVATYLGLHLNGLTIRKYNISALNYPYVEAGDLCIIHDGRGNAFNSYVTNLTFTYGQYEMFSCGAEEPSRNNVVHYSEYAKTIAESKRSTQEMISEYDIAVQNMTQLAVNSMGYHQTVQEQADGSRITYLHDKPLLADSETIYKISIDGFFISTDGGETYSSGFDADGNVVVNILSAIGIKFDWARGGTLTLGGTDNAKGTLSIIGDDDSSVFARMDNETFEIQSADYQKEEFSNTQTLYTQLYTFSNGTTTGYFGEFPIYYDSYSRNLTRKLHITFAEPYTGNVTVLFRAGNYTNGNDETVTVSVTDATYCELIVPSPSYILRWTWYVESITTTNAQVIEMYAFCYDTGYQLARKYFTPSQLGSGNKISLSDNSLKLNLSEIRNDGFYYKNLRLSDYIFVTGEIAKYSASEEHSLSLRIEQQELRALSKLVIVDFDSVTGDSTFNDETFSYTNFIDEVDMSLLSTLRIYRTNHTAGYWVSVKVGLDGAISITKRVRSTTITPTAPTATLIFGTL